MRKWTPLKRHPGIFTYETQKGKRFGVRRAYTDSHHKYRNWSKSGFTNWREADIELKKFEVTLSTGELTESMSNRITLQNYFDKLIKRNVALKMWRPATVTQKQNYWNNQLKPIFGKQLINEITRQSYQNFIDQMIKDGYAKNTIITTNSVMQIIMNDAARNDVIAKNKLSSISIDGGKSPVSKSLSEKDYKKIMDKAPEVLNKYQYCLVSLLTLGERREELMGLQFKSFKFQQWNDEEICAITFLKGRTNAEPEGGNLKNDASYRTIYVRGDMANICKYVITYSRNIYAKTHRECTDESFLFVNEKTGMPMGVQQANKILKKVGDAVKVHVTPHIFRHYFATMALTNGQVATDVMHWLGHSSLQMTQNYTRENVRGALNVFNGMEPTLLGEKKDEG
ncbi:tyrosine-type recombinase/integrase [Lactiplantibacillus paraxiangfangensis]|uniref:tyrosine-type recombinase/integrase n=1 Tax=Lactiplantibacillus paraxiangfangensis TaxID=3076224 RepID=UPI0030C67522